MTPRNVTYYQRRPRPQSYAEPRSVQRNTAGRLGRPARQRSRGRRRTSRAPPDARAPKARLRFTVARNRDSGGSSGAAEPPHEALSDFPKRLCVREGAQLLQRLVLDLPDPLARDV